MNRHLLPLLPPHTTYCEPYFGSGSMFFAKEPAKVEFINDLDGHVVNFFRVLRLPNQCRELQRLLTLTPYSPAEYKHCGQFPYAADPVERARRLFVRIEQSYQSNPFGSSWSFSNNNIPSQVADKVDRLHTYIQRLRRTYITNWTALKAISNADSFDTLFLLDPPYYGIRGYYGHEEHHEQLLDVVQRVRGKVMLHGYRSKLYDDRLRKWRRLEWETSCTTATVTVVRMEVCWMNFPSSGRIMV